MEINLFDKSDFLGLSPQRTEELASNVCAAKVPTTSL